jgi:hypothetical protein
MKRLMDSLPMYVAVSYAQTDAERKTVAIDFSETGFGFGVVTMVQDGTGLYVDSEYMGREKVLELVSRMLERAVFDLEKDPEKHLRYNEVMNRGCGPKCTVCAP